VVVGLPDIAILHRIHRLCYIEREGHKMIALDCSEILSDYLMLDWDDTRDYGDAAGWNIDHSWLLGEHREWYKGALSMIHYEMKEVIGEFDGQGQIENWVQNWGYLENSLGGGVGANEFALGEERKASKVYLSFKSAGHLEA
jgi:hypothetical protein